MIEKMLRVGLTGNIGSGKSTVARLFQQLGIPVYFADERAKWLMAHDPTLRQRIIDIFGEQSYSDDQPPTLNRAFLAEQVFNNDEKLTQLNAIVHPAVAKDALQWHQAQKSVPYTLYEAAITFETGGYKQLDKVIVVSAPQTTRLARVMQRDGSNEDQVLARMAKQWPEEKKVALADYVIDNGGSRLLMPQVISVHHQLLASTP